MMSDYKKAEYIAGTVSRWAKGNKYITAEKVLEKCASKRELDWWYCKIRDIKN